MKLLRKWTDVKISPVWPTARSAAIIRSGSPAPKPGDKISSTVYVKSANSIPGHWQEPSQQGSVQSSKMLKLTCLPCAFQLKRPLSDSISVRGCMYINIYIYIYICMYREREKYTNLLHFNQPPPPRTMSKKVYLAPAYMKLVGMINRCLSRKV